jgi:hypothetical protein
VADEPRDADDEYRPARIALAVMFGLAGVYLLVTREVVDVAELTVTLCFVAGMVAVTLRKP